MNLFMFFVLPLATILLSIVLQKILKSPLLVAITFFAIYLIVAFIAFPGNLAEALIATIIYTIIAYVTAYIAMIICRIRRRLCQNENNNNNNANNDANNNVNNNNNCDLNRQEYSYFDENSRIDSMSEINNTRNKPVALGNNIINNMQRRCSKRR